MMHATPPTPDSPWQLRSRTTDTRTPAARRPPGLQDLRSEAEKGVARHQMDWSRPEPGRSSKTRLESVALPGECVPAAAPLEDHLRLRWPSIIASYENGEAQGFGLLIEQL